MIRPSVQPEPLLVNVATAARMLCLSDRTLWSLSERGELPRVKIGRAVRYDVADLQAFIDRAKEKS